MAKINSLPESTPARPSPLNRKASSAASDKSQRSILGFFPKTALDDSEVVLKSGRKSNVLANRNSISNSSQPYKKPEFSKARSQNITPVPSSDAAQPPSSQEGTDEGLYKVDIGLSLPLTPAESNIKQRGKSRLAAEFSSPSLKVLLLSKIIGSVLTNSLARPRKKSAMPSPLMTMRMLLQSI
jgi:hypothetical protein